jgi:hypothetical protein
MLDDNSLRVPEAACMACSVSADIGPEKEFGNELHAAPFFLNKIKILNIIT